MSNAFTRAMSTPTPQNEAAEATQVKNNAGGYTFTVEDKIRLERFLILGTEKGTYYSDEKKLTKENVGFLKSIIENNEDLVIKIVREISTSGRALRNSPAIFAVAALFAWGKQKPSSLLSDVARTSTMLFEFAEYVELLGGWGSAKRRAVADWYIGKPTETVAYQAVKYRQRNGWTHRDLLRLSHPVGVDSEVVKFILGKSGKLSEAQTAEQLPIIHAFQKVQSANSVTELTSILAAYPVLPWEAIPTQFHKSPEVWKHLFYSGNLRGQALLRNITRLARIGAFNDMVFEADYAAKLRDEEMIKATRLHPFHYLITLVVHRSGQIDRKNNYGYGRKKDWITSNLIMDALNAGYHAAFKYAEPANKRTLLGLDISGSMSSSMSGTELTAAQCVAAMAMTVARTEPYYKIMGFAHTFRDLGIDASMSLSSVLRTTENQAFGSTDCALPMTWALKQGIEVDTFVVMTDNETWSGNIHPHVALEQYRQKTGIPAKLIVVACTPTEFTIANPADRGMLDVVGADANLPKLIADFSAGRI